VVASIRGEGAETRFAEVTFTHQTWAKINAEMDTKFTSSAIVGWYHTHPDFGIFLSDRDRFIHEHFFSGPGQIAHVIDPIRGLEGVFVWRDAKPAIAPHFWVGDQIMVAASAGADGSLLGTAADTLPSRLASERLNSLAQGDTAPHAGPRSAGVVPTAARLILYGGMFLLGYLFASLVSAWEHERFVANVLASNSFVAVLRLGLADELDHLSADLKAGAQPLESVRKSGEKADEALTRVRDRLADAIYRVSAIKSRYGNTPAEDELLRRLLREKLMAPSESPSRPSSPSIGRESKPTRDPPQPNSPDPKTQATPKPNN
jgi:hypothetical protein